jgi:hypothetical protein
MSSIKTATPPMPPAIPPAVAPSVDLTEVEHGDDVEHDGVGPDDDNEIWPDDGVVEPDDDEVELDDDFECDDGELDDDESDDDEPDEPDEVVELGNGEAMPDEVEPELDLR